MSFFHKINVNKRKTISLLLCDWKVKPQPLSSVLLCSIRHRGHLRCRYSIYTGARREREAWAWKVNVRREFLRSHYSIYPVSVKTIIVLSFSLAKKCHYKVSQFLTLMCGFGYIHGRKYKRKYRWWLYVIFSKKEPFGLTST